MQHNKIRDNLGEFQKFIDSGSKTDMCLEDTIRFFDIQRIFGRFESVKQSGIRVTMIMTLGSGSKWKTFITNDLQLEFNKLMETYHIRWSCEVFFRDGKQHLQLGKCQCNNFDSQIGTTTLAMMQYMMLILYKQMHYGNSLGSIFDMLSSQAEEENITRYLLEIFREIVNGIGEIFKVDCMELFEEIIKDDKKAEEVMRLFSPLLEKKQAA